MDDSAGTAGSGETLAEYQSERAAGARRPNAVRSMTFLSRHRRRPAGARRGSIGLTTGRVRGPSRPPEPSARQGRRGVRPRCRAVEAWNRVEADRVPRRAGRVGCGRELGDGAGYDIASFRVDGSPLHIEVKTAGAAQVCGHRSTSLRWEVETSKDPRGCHLGALSRLRLRSEPRGTTVWTARR